MTSVLIKGRKYCSTCKEIKKTLCSVSLLALVVLHVKSV